MTSRRLLPWIGSVLLFVAMLATGAALVGWKRAALDADAAAAAAVPEPIEAITVAVAREREHRRSTTTIGTVLALRSITLQNEMAGTVAHVALTPGEIVDEGTILVVLDVSVEEAELKAQEAQAALAETLLGRMQRASESKAVPAMEVDRARAERDVALAQIERTRAVIARKTIRAPFRARIGLSDVHLGQYLNEGSELTTLQGVDDAVHVDFTVNQEVAAGLHEGDDVEVFTAGGSPPVAARIVAVDARVDSRTRNAMVRARIEDRAGSEGPSDVPAPGSSVRVRVPIGGPRSAVAIPVSALRKGPSGDHVFVIEPDKAGAPASSGPGGAPVTLRAHVRQVESGTMLGDEVVILEGLAAGERVAASGSFKLSESAAVVIAGTTTPSSQEEAR